MLNFVVHSFTLPALLAIVLLLLCQCPSSFAGVAGFGGSGRGRKPTGDPVHDYGQPITHPMVMIPFIGTIIMVTVMLCSCCNKLINPGKEKDLAPPERLQLGRKPRSRSRSASFQPELALSRNGKIKQNCAKTKDNANTNSLRPDIIESTDLDCLPYNYYYKPASADHEHEQLA